MDEFPQKTGAEGRKTTAAQMCVVCSNSLCSYQD